MNKRLLAALVTIVATIGCDRITKTMATASLRGEGPRSFLQDTLRLEYAENRGAFLGLGRNFTEPARFWIFTAGTAALLCLVALHVGFSLARDGANVLPWTLLLAGGVSNLLDRATSGGRVVDFLNLGLGSFRTGIFNVADLAITVAAFVLIFRQVERG